MIEKLLEIKKHTYIKNQNSFEFKDDRIEIKVMKEN